MIISTSILIIFVCVVKVQSENCVTPNNEQGQCIHIHSCPILLGVANEGSSGDEFIQKSICGGSKFSPKVCCGSSSNFTENKSSVAHTNEKVNKSTSLLPDRTYCGLQHSDDYFRPKNDTSVRINEFPWLAHLLYRDKSSGKEDFKCTGSLINRRYVLTAAQCIDKIKNFELIGVRLGEYYYSNKSDCVQEPPFDQECSDVQNYAIEKRIPHPDFDIYTNDIGLLRLDKKIVYSDYIRPICLPQPGIPLANIGDTLTSSGWGITETTVRKESKKKILGILITNDECNNIYGTAFNVTENHICTKAIDNITDVNCKYDNGAPIMSSHRFQWQQEGISSIGTAVCGIRRYPSINTRVVNYLKWIEENLEP